MLIYWYNIPALVALPFSVISEKNLPDIRTNPLLSRISEGDSKAHIEDVFGNPDYQIGTE